MNLKTLGRILLLLALTLGFAVLGAFAKVDGPSTTEGEAE
jgi:hypothetical protein